MQILSLGYSHAVIDFILRYPEHKHYVAANYIPLRQLIKQKLEESGKKAIICVGATFTSKALHMVDTGEVDVLISAPTIMSVGWKTEEPNRTISFVEPIEPPMIVQGAFRLRGDNSRIGFAHKNNMASSFRDVLISEVFHSRDA